MIRFRNGLLTNITARAPLCYLGLVTTVNYELSGFLLVCHATSCQGNKTLENEQGWVSIEK